MNSTESWMTVISWGRSEGELIVPDKHQMIQLNKMPSYQRTDMILGRVRHAENAAKRFLQLLSKMNPSLSPLLQLLCGIEQDPNFHRNTLLNVWPIQTENNEANMEELDGDRMQGQMKAKLGSGFVCSLSPTYVSSNPSTHGRILFSNLQVPCDVLF